MKKVIKKIPDFWNYLSDEQINQMYESEIKHSNRLRISDPIKRRLLYEKVYEDYYSELPFHPAFKLKEDAKTRNNRLEFQLYKIKALLNKKEIFVEIGAGDCSLSINIAPYVSKVYALEISETYASQEKKTP